MKAIICSLFLAVCASSLFGQEDVHSVTVTLGAGGQPYSYNWFDEHGGPVFHGAFEYRILRYLAVEAGIDTLLPSTTVSELLPVIPAGQVISNGATCPACVIVLMSSSQRVELVPFGLKGIWPMASGRVELFGGFGGGYAFSSAYGASHDALLAQASVGGRFSLDRQGRFWLGTTLRGYFNTGPGKQVWAPLTFDFGIRFGHKG